jgi:hypothetical protein
MLVGEMSPWASKGHGGSSAPACAAWQTTMRRATLSHAACLAAGSLLPKRKGGDDADDGKGVTHDDIWCLDLKTHQVRLSFFWWGYAGQMEAENRVKRAGLGLCQAGLWEAMNAMGWMAWC